MIERGQSQEPKCFITKPTTSLCKIRLNQSHGTLLEPISVTHIPINSIISTTGHKYYERALDRFVVNKRTFKFLHWAYATLSMVMILNILKMKI